MLKLERKVSITHVIPLVIATLGLSAVVVGCKDETMSLKTSTSAPVDNGRFSERDARYFVINGVYNTGMNVEDEEAYIFSGDFDPAKKIYGMGLSSKVEKSDASVVGDMEADLSVKINRIERYVGDAMVKLLVGEKREHVKELAAVAYQYSTKSEKEGGSNAVLPYERAQYVLARLTKLKDQNGGSLDEVTPDAVMKSIVSEPTKQLYDELEKSNNNIAALFQKTDTLSSEIEGLRSEIATIKERLAGHDKRLTDAEKAMCDLEGKCADLSSQLGTTQQSLKGTQDDLGKTQQSLKGTQADLEKTREVVRVIRSDLDFYADIVDLLKGESDAEKEAALKAIKDLKASREKDKKGAQQLNGQRK